MNHKLYIISFKLEPLTGAVAQQRRRDMPGCGGDARHPIHVKAVKNKQGMQQNAACAARPLPFPLF